MGFYAIGWALLAAGVALYEVSEDTPVKLALYKGATWGLFSWIGVILVVAFVATGCAIEASNRINHLIK